MYVMKYVIGLLNDLFFSVIAAYIFYFVCKYCDIVAYQQRLTQFWFQLLF